MLSQENSLGRKVEHTEVVGDKKGRSRSKMT